MAEHDTELVLSAFEKFSEASANMEAAYQHLAGQFRALSQELEEANRELKRTVGEKERIGLHLRAVLESLECGVLVADRAGKITHSNQPAASLLFGDSKRSSPLRTMGELGRARPELAMPLETDGPSHFETTLSMDGEVAERCVEIERRDLQGETGGAVFVIRDLTEIRALERQAQKMERMAAMGEMALELAHEVRNPLGSIRLHASLLRGDDELSEGSRRSVQQLEVGIRSLNNAVSNMLSFGRPQPPLRVPTDLRQLVEEVGSFLEPLTRERNVQVDLRHCEPVPFAKIDPEQFRQVLLNLWLNSLNAMPRGGRLSIWIRAEGNALRLDFRDTGPGLSPEVLEHVFDPFFSTDRKGTGLGLAVASQIVNQNGGAIRAESEPGEGATFRIMLESSEEVTCAVKF